MRSNVAHLSITIPLEILEQVRNFFDSSIAISGYLKKQVQYRAATEKVQSASYQAELKKKSLIFSTLILSNFDLFISQGASPRIAIKQTRDLLNSRGHDLTCAMIELFVRKSGRLSKRRKSQDIKEGIHCEKQKRNSNTTGKKREVRQLALSTSL